MNLSNVISKSKVKTLKHFNNLFLCILVSIKIRFASEVQDLTINTNDLHCVIQVFQYKLIQFLSAEDLDLQL